MGYGGTQTELPVADELAPRRNPPATTPVRKVRTPESQSSMEYTVVDVKECGVQTEEGVRGKTTLEEDKVERRINKYLKAVEEAIRGIVTRGGKVDIWIQEKSEEASVDVVQPSCRCRPGEAQEEVAYLSDSELKAAGMVGTGEWVKIRGGITF